MINCIDTIETSSICDNKCKYCPSKDQHKYRETGFMTLETLEKTMKIVDYCVSKGTQTTTNLFGIGEPLLNPDIVEMVRIAKKHLPPTTILNINTNGNNMTEELAKNLKDAGVTMVSVTGHKPIVAAKAIRILRQYGIFGVMSMDFALSPNDWAGQVKWYTPEYTYPCPWLEFGRVFIMWDGRITRCCLDAFAKGVVGTVDDDPSKIELTPFELCNTCHSDPKLFARVNGHTIRKTEG